MRIIFLIAANIFLASCVSVNLGTGKATRAKDVEFKNPPLPFEKMKNEAFDESWLNTQNGNTIAFLSECKIKAEISLQLMETESLAALENLKILKSEIVEFNERQGKEVVAEGSVDGIQVKIRLMLLKKNECNYTVSYVGRKKSFEENLPFFAEFLKEFKAP